MRFNFKIFSRIFFLVSLDSARALWKSVDRKKKPFSVLFYSIIKKYGGGELCRPGRFLCDNLSARNRPFLASDNFSFVIIFTWMILAQADHELAQPFLRRTALAESDQILSEPCKMLKKTIPVLLG
jgi:hypothetical protein